MVRLRRHLVKIQIVVVVDAGLGDWQSCFLLQTHHVVLVCEQCDLVWYTVTFIDIMVDFYMVHDGTSLPKHL